MRPDERGLELELWNVKTRMTGGRRTLHHTKGYLSVENVPSAATDALYVSESQVDSALSE